MYSSHGICRDVKSRETGMTETRRRQTIHFFLDLLQMVASVLKDHSAFISEVKHSLPEGQEDENYTVFWNFSSSFPVNSVRASDLACKRHFKIIHATLKFFSQPLLVVRREFPYHRWEPIYIGTNEEPLYSEELTWEGQQDKMTQVL